jgi:adenylate cyclase class 2
VLDWRLARAAKGKSQVKSQGSAREPGAGIHLETEIKLRVASATQGRTLLRRAGFEITAPRVVERNVIFDTPDRALRQERKVLRLRQAGRRATFALKGPPLDGRYKSREEVESQVADPAALRAILARLGYEPAFLYEKRRTEFRRPGESGLATLDETAAGVFIELEGTPRWIDRAARLLGFSAADYITASYGRLLSGRK